MGHDYASKSFGDVEMHTSTEQMGSRAVEPRRLELERRVVRKLDLHLVPLVAGLYLLAFLDRSNIGNARIAGMSEDLQLQGDRYDWLLTIFYIAYIVFDFGILMWKVVPPHLWLTFVVFGWGVAATCQAASQSWAGMMTCRFFLGMFEIFFGPGVVYLLSFFYLRHEVGLRSGIFLASAPLATCFAGALAYGITSGHPSIANWRLLFLVEGLPVIAMVPVVYFCMPDTPQQARFLDEDEKKAALARTIRQAGHESRIGALDLKQTWATFSDPAAFLTAFMYFACNVSFASLPVFLPTILMEMGFSGVTAQGLSAPPYFLSWIVTIFTTWIADRSQQRGFMIIAMSTIGGIGYIILAATSSVGARYTGVVLAACGVFPSIANILPWVVNNQGNDSRRGAGVVILNVIGQCGPLLGTRIFPLSEGPYYVKGQAICAAFMFFTALLALILRMLLVFRNRAMDRKFGSLEDQRRRPVSIRGEGEENHGREQLGLENYGPMFRYVV